MARPLPHNLPTAVLLAQAHPDLDQATPGSNRVTMLYSSLVISMKEI